MTSCLVTFGSEEDFSNFHDVDNLTKSNDLDFEPEKLPNPSSRISGPEARNYVAYIPVPINEGEDEEEEDDEYYDDSDEYYDDDEEYYDEDEYYEEDEPPRRPNKKSKKKKFSSSKRRKGVRRRYEEQSSKGDKERVPFLVPLMMVPENQVGVEKEFSFAKNPTKDRKDDVNEGIFDSILNLKNNGQNKPSLPYRRRIPPNRLQRPRGPPARNVYDVPGPPYRGPNPRNPNLPLDNTIIHPSNLRPRFRRPPRNFRPFRPRTTTQTTTTTTEMTTTATTETTTKSKPSIIVVQQKPSYNPYQPSPYNPYPMYQPYYPPPQQPYQYPPQTVPTTTSTTTTTTTKTTTKKPKRRRKKKKPTPKPKPQSDDRYITRLSEDQMTSLSQPQLTIKNNKVVPVLNPQQQSILTKRFGLPAVQARRFNNPSYSANINF